MDWFCVVLSGDGDVGIVRVEVDEQLFEDGLVELALTAAGEPSVELVGALEQVQLSGEDVGALLAAFAGGGPLALGPTRRYFVRRDADRSELIELTRALGVLGPMRRALDVLGATRAGRHGPVL
ncbi:hypothetical protein [Kineosporia succinea]|uniref:hypothetical protein n=1 Tax=Kineosporia succinea TaxID=84632 RepID=UPI0027D83F8A|nr:hypothetical protein [Kineosporia succinea]